MGLIEKKDEADNNGHRRTSKRKSLNFEMLRIGSSFKARGQRTEVRDQQKPINLDIKKAEIRGQGLSTLAVNEKRYPVEKAKGNAKK